jgi:hypothetical protein
VVAGEPDELAGQGLFFFFCCLLIRALKFPCHGLFLLHEPVPKLIDCALKCTVLDQALAVFQAKALQNCVF